MNKMTRDEAVRELSKISRRQRIRQWRLFVHRPRFKPPSEFPILPRYIVLQDIVFTGGKRYSKLNEFHREVLRTVRSSILESVHK